MAEVEREAALLASAGEPRPRAAPSAKRAPARGASARAADARASALACVRAARRRRRPARCCSAAGDGAHDPFESTHASRPRPSSRSTDDGAIARRQRPAAAAGGQDLHGLAPAAGARARADVGAVHAAPRRLGDGVGDRRPGGRRGRAGQHRAGRRLDDADLRPVLLTAIAHASAIASSPRTSRSIANSKRSSGSPATRSSARPVMIGNCSGGSEREVRADLLGVAWPAAQALLVGERADVEREHVGRVGDHPRRQRRGRQHRQVALQDRQRVRAGRDRGRARAARRRGGCRDMPARVARASSLTVLLPVLRVRARGPGSRRRSGPAAGPAAPPCRRRASTATRRRRRAPAPACASRGPAGRRARAATSAASTIARG